MTVDFTEQREVRMPELPQVRIVEAQPTQQWMEEVTDKFGAQVDENTGELTARYTVRASVEDWLVQPRDHEASSYFTVDDMMGPDGWKQTIQGRFFRADETHLPQALGGNIAPVLAIFDAEVVRPDGETQKIGEGRTVLVRLERMTGQEVPFVPVA